MISIKKIYILTFFVVGLFSLATPPALATNSKNESNNGSQTQQTENIQLTHDEFFSGVTFGLFDNEDFAYKAALNPPKNLNEPLPGLVSTKISSDTYKHSSKSANVDFGMLPKQDYWLVELSAPEGHPRYQEVRKYNPLSEQFDVVANLDYKEKDLGGIEIKLHAKSFPKLTNDLDGHNFADVSGAHFAVYLTEQAAKERKDEGKIIDLLKTNQAGELEMRLPFYAEKPLYLAQTKSSEGGVFYEDIEEIKVQKNVTKILDLGLEPNSNLHPNLFPSAEAELGTRFAGKTTIAKRESVQEIPRGSLKIFLVSPTEKNKQNDWGKDLARELDYSEATFDIYLDEQAAKTKDVTKLAKFQYDYAPHRNISLPETDKTGYIKQTDIPIGTYYVAQTKPPKGYKPDNEIHKIEIKPDQENHLYIKIFPETIIKPQVEQKKELENNKPENNNLNEDENFGEKNVIVLPKVAKVKIQIDIGANEDLSGVAFDAYSTKQAAEAKDYSYKITDFEEHNKALTNKDGVVSQVYVAGQTIFLRQKNPTIGGDLSDEIFEATIKEDEIFQVIVKINKNNFVDGNVSVQSKDVGSTASEETVKHENKPAISTILGESGENKQTSEPGTPVIDKSVGSAEVEPIKVEQSDAKPAVKEESVKLGEAGVVELSPAKTQANDSVAKQADPSNKQNTSQVGNLAISGTNKAILYAFVGFSGLLILVGVVMLFRKKQTFKY